MLYLFSNNADLGSRPVLGAARRVNVMRLRNRFTRDEGDHKGGTPKDAIKAGRFVDDMFRACAPLGELL